MIIKKVLAEAGNWRKHVSALADYVTSASADDGGEKCLLSWGENFFSNDPERMKAEMMALVDASQVTVATERTIIQHWVMSWGEKEKPDIAGVGRAAKDFLKGMGMETHQAVVGVHVNTENIHVHIMVSRVDPATHKTTPGWNDVVKAHAVLAGIEKSMRAEPERNAMFSWNICSGPTPNPRYRPRNSLSFAYASPETVMLEIPDGLEVKFSGMRRKGDCFYYPGKTDAAAILSGNKLYFFNWAYRDTVLEIKKLKDLGATIVVQKDLAPVFMDAKDASSRKELREWTKATFADGDIDVFTGLPDAPVPDDPRIRLRARPPSFPLEIREMRHARNPLKYWKDIRRRYLAKGVPEIRLRTICALHMRAHSFVRRDIEYCLLMDGMEAQYARHVSRWLYSPKGNMELFRQKMQGTLVMERESALRKRPEKEKRKKRPLLRKDPWGRLVAVGTEKKRKKAPRLDEKTIDEEFAAKAEARAGLRGPSRKKIRERSQEKEK